MKKKFLLLAGCLFAYIGLQPTLAQTDVTSTYIQNADFETTPLTYSKATGATSPQTDRIGTTGQIYTVPGWTNASVCKNNAVQIATAEYGMTTSVSNGLNSTTPPSADNAGNGGAALHMSAGWGDDAIVTQKATLPAGIYELTYYVYNQNSSATGIAVNFTGVTLADGTSKTGTLSTAPYGEWVSETITFSLASEQEVTFRLGFTTSTGGSGAGSKLYVDNLTLKKYDLDDFSSQNPFTLPFSSSWTGNSGSYTSGGVAMLEKYRDSPWTGDVMSQTLSNLPNGKYEVDLYLNASACEWQFTSTITNGAENLTNVYGNDTYSLTIPVYKTKSVSTPSEWTLSGLIVKDGTLKIDIRNDGTGANWIIVANKALRYLGPDLSALSEVFNDALTAAKAVDQTLLNTGVKNELSAVITTYDGNEPATRVDYETAINALTTVTDKANEVALLYPRLAGYNAVYANSIATTTQKAAYKAVLDEQSALIEAATTAAAISEALNTIETARRTYVQVAQPTNGTTFDFTFLIDGVGNSTSGWKRDFGSQNYTYKTSTEKNTETCVSAGFIEMWHSGPLSGTLTYTKSGLPNGLYNLSAYVFGNQQGTTSLTAGAASVALSTDTKLFQDLTVSGAEVSDGSLTFGLSVTNDNWVGITNVRLAYAGSAHAYADYTAAKATADAYLDKVISASIKATINANNTLTESNTSAELLQAVANLNEAVAEAAVSEANYAYLQREVATAKSVGVDVTAWEAAIAAATYSTEEALAEGRKANVATYNQVERAYTHNSEISNAWSGGDIGTATGQHWSGNASTSYYDTNGTDITRSLTNSVTLPAGEYVFKGAGRSNANTSMTLQIGDNTVTYTAKGDTGYGIDTSGAANYDAGGTYANNNAGRGWEWEFVHLTLTEETTVTLTATIKTSGWGWGSFSDLSLKMSDESYKEYCYPLLATALGECVPWTTGDTYADTTYPSYQTNYTNKTYATGDEVLAAIAELRAAYKAYAISLLDKDHPYDVTSLIVNPSFDDGMNGWGAAQNSTDGYTQSTAGGVYSYSASKQLRHASIYQTIESLEAGVYTLSAKVKGDPLADDKTYIYATTGTVDHWANPVFDGYVTYGYYTTANNGAEKVVSTTFVLSETSNVRIGILSWGNNVSGNTKGGFSVDEWTLKRVLYGVDGEASAPVITGAIPASDLQALVDGGISAIDLTAATGLSAVALTTTANPNLLVYAASGQVSNTSNVIVDGVCARLKLTDGHPFMAPTAFTATAAEYEMGAVASDAAGTVSFGTLCLPFEVSTLAGNAYKLDQGVTLGGEIYATSVTTLPANTPALVTSKGTYSGSGAVSATPAGTLCTGGELVGVYSSTPAPVGSMVLQKHSDKVAFYLVDEVQPTVKPFRAYIRPQSNEVKMASVLFDDATGLTGVSVETGLTVVKRYNSAGQAISRPEKGINLLRMSDGSVRKVLVK